MGLGITVKVKKLSPLVILPERMSEDAAGMDVRALLANPLLIPAGGMVTIPTGLSLEIPCGFEAQVRPRSGLAAKYGITILNAPGTIDADYRGEIKIILINFGKEDRMINSGDRIAQLVFAPVTKVVLQEADELAETNRGGAGFGSTGNV